MEWHQIAYFVPMVPLRIYSLTPLLEFVIHLASTVLITNVLTYSIINFVQPLT